MASSRLRSLLPLYSVLLACLAVTLEVVPGASGFHQHLHCKKWQSNCIKYQEHCQDEKPKLQTWESCMEVAEYESSATGPDGTAAALESNVYWIKDGGPFSIKQAYCDTETDGGGWMTVLRRMDSSVDFDRTWTEYEEGFGELDGNFFYGLKALNRMTCSSNAFWELRVDLTFENGSSRHANYEYFRVEGKSTNYTLHLDKYGNTSTADDNLGRFQYWSFSTSDYGAQKDNCAKNYNAGWWYTSDNCRGLGDKGVVMTAPYGSIATHWFFPYPTQKFISIPHYEMKIRPKKFTSSSHGTIDSTHSAEPTSEPTNLA